MNPRASGFDSFFCQPGKEGAHEKGGVEGEIGRFRRRHMTPVPRAASLAELNQMLADADEVDEHRRIAARVETVGQAAAREVPLLNPVTGQRVPGGGGVTVPGRREGEDLCPAVVLFGARLSGRRVQVALGADWLDVRHDGVLVARHTRSTCTRGSENLVLDQLPGGARPPPPGVRWPGPPPWSAPGRPACSPMGTNGSGTPHAARPGTGTAPRR